MLDIQMVSDAIRDAVAPVFLLTGVGSILGVLVGRLVRSLDRAREMHRRLEEHFESKLKSELRLAIRRIKWLRRAIGFATLGALSICISIVTLFVAVETGWQLAHVVLWSFVGAMTSIIVALLCFLREVLLASQGVIVSSQVNYDE